VPCLTTVSAALAAAEGMRDWGNTDLRVRSLQEYLDPSAGEQQTLL
jgi:hypothetical protein